MTDRAADRLPDSSTSTIRPKSVGARVKRTEDPRLLTGAGRYVADIALNGMLHVAFKRSDYAYGQIRSIDKSAALASPGVVAVLSAQDIANECEPARAASRMAKAHSTAIFPLASERVRYVGEPVVAVIAESRYTAEDAVDQLEIDIEPLEAANDPVDAIKPNAPLLHEDIGTNILVEREFLRGEPAEAIASAHLIVRARFRFHRKTPLAMETRSYLADFDRGRNSLTLHSSTQIPGIIRNALCEMLSLKGNQVRVIAPEVGGGFGSKASLYAEELLVCVASRKLGRPVRWISDRLEDLISTSQGFDEVIEAEMAFDADGHAVALSAEIIGDVGAHSIYPWTAGLEPVQVASFLPGPYRIQNYRGFVQAVATPKAPTGPYRGVGRPPAAFVTERLLDMAAGKLGLDPLDIRRRNLVQDDEFPFKAGSGIVWDKTAFVECLETAAERLGYAELRKLQVERREAGQYYGIGLASYAELTGIGSRISVAPGMPINTGTETSTISIDPTGSIVAQFGLASHGQGLETTLAQVVSDHLGAKLDDIEIIQGDSSATVNGSGTYASRSAVLGAGAGQKAGQAVRGKILKVAAHLMEVAEDDLDVHDSQVLAVGTNKAMSFKEIASAVYTELGRLPEDLRGELVAKETYDPVFGTTAAATHAVALEIDPETFEVKIEKFVVAEDCGELINPMIVDGQVHGGVAQGIGAALYEEIVYDPDGQILTGNLADYLAPFATEVPSMDVIHVESPSPTTLGGFRGMGEGGTIGAPAAIANAIADALSPLNIEITELPMTPDRIFRLVQDAETKTKA